MNKYELALVLNAKVEDEVRLATLEKAKGYITRYNGVITGVEEWGKKRLAYEIQKMREGYYYFIQFEAEPTCPVELEGHMHIMDNVLRYLIVSRTENDVPAEATQPTEKEGQLAKKEEQPAEKEGQSAEKEGQPTEKEGQPTEKEGQPTEDASSAEQATSEQEQPAKEEAPL